MNECTFWGLGKNLCIGIIIVELRYAAGIKLRLSLVINPGEISLSKTYNLRELFE
jgi:hypothetical protein